MRDTDAGTQCREASLVYDFYRAPRTKHFLQVLTGIDDEFDVPDFVLGLLNMRQRDKTYRYYEYAKLAQNEFAKLAQNEFPQAMRTGEDGGGRVFGTVLALSFLETRVPSCPWLATLQEFQQDAVRTSNFFAEVIAKPFCHDLDHTLKAPQDAEQINRIAGAWIDGGALATVFIGQMAPREAPRQVVEMMLAANHASTAGNAQNTPVVEQFLDDHFPSEEKGNEKVRQDSGVLHAAQVLRNTVHQFRQPNNADDEMGRKMAAAKVQEASGGLARAVLLALLYNTSNELEPNSILAGACTSIGAQGGRLSVDNPHVFHKPLLEETTYGKLTAAMVPYADHLRAGWGPRLDWFTIRRYGNTPCSI